VNSPDALGLLSAMITPAVLISACGTLILSTSTRLARIMDRVRELGGASEGLFSGSARFAEIRLREVEGQLGVHSQRGRLLQRALTSFYYALGVFVATAIAIALVNYAARAHWVPGLLGIGGMVTLFYGCVMLLRETRLAMRAVDAEMAFVVEINELYRKEGKAAGSDDLASRRP
jgi:hypothetical protein